MVLIRKDMRGAIINSGPHEDTTHISSADVVRR